MWYKKKFTKICKVVFLWTDHIACLRNLWWPRYWAMQNQRGYLRTIHFSHFNFWEEDASFSFSVQFTLKSLKFSIHITLSIPEGVLPELMWASGAPMSALSSAWGSTVMLVYCRWRSLANSCKHRQLSCQSLEDNMHLSLSHKLLENSYIYTTVLLACLDPQQVLYKQLLGAKNKKTKRILMCEVTVFCVQ